MIKRLIYFLLIGTILINCNGLAQISSDNKFDLQKTRTELSEKIDKTLKDTGIPSISIALAKDDKIVWAEAFGYANVKMKIKATKESIYCTGSTFKFVTATAIMQLQEQGKLNIDDPVNKYLGEEAIDDYSEKGTAVTFRHLLSHHSGLSGPIEIIPLWNRKLPKTLREVVADINATKDPGIEYKYCNHCYALAGYLIEKISDMSYEDYIVENILKPLKITNLGPVVPSPTMTELMALPYSMIGKRAIPIHRTRFDVFPAGDIQLSAPDMAKFLAAQANSGSFQGISLLNPESVEEMQTKQFGGDYGLGTGVVVRDKKKFLLHAGGVAGFHSYFIVDTQNKTAVYIVTNTNTDLNELSEICQLAIKLLNGK